MDIEDLRFFNPYDEIRQGQNRLPHWQQKGAVYFVTFRLADSVPAHLLREWEAERETWTKLHPLPWSPETEREYHRRFSAQFDTLLDASHGSCPLRKPEVAQTVSGALTHFEGERCVQISWVVMPNHVHALFVLRETEKLEGLLHSWKTWTARLINIHLGRSGTLWQKDYFDRLIRDDQHFHRCVRYIRRNPEKANLREHESLLWESNLAQTIE